MAAKFRSTLVLDHNRTKRSVTVLPRDEAAVRAAACQKLRISAKKLRGLWLEDAKGSAAWPASAISLPEVAHDGITVVASTTRAAPEAALLQQGQDKDPPAVVRVLAHASWLEDGAVQQLVATAGLPGCRLAVGMPDLHPGRGYPNGAAVATQDLWPHLIGTDIGCGMSLVQTDLPSGGATPKSLERWAGAISAALSSDEAPDAVQAVTPAQKAVPTSHPSTPAGQGGAQEVAAEPPPPCTPLAWPSAGPHAAVVPPLAPPGSTPGEVAAHLLHHGHTPQACTHALPPLPPSLPPLPRRAHPPDAAAFSSFLGTVGRGNHFAELQVVQEVLDQAAWDALALDAAALQLVVHSGSRGYGAAVLDWYVTQCGSGSTPADSPVGAAYLALHNHACVWAKHNRAAIATRLLAALPGSHGHGTCVLDAWHNFVTAAPFGDSALEPLSVQPGAAEAGAGGDGGATVRQHAGGVPVQWVEGPLPPGQATGGGQGQTLWLHRKGASPSDGGPMLIPGSRGTPTYLVQPTADEGVLEASGRSLAHGAGRKWSRAKGRAMLRDLVRRAGDLRQTELGGRVVCGDADLLLEEAPPNYKDVSAVVADLQEAGIVTVIAILHPLLTFKTAE